MGLKPEISLGVGLATAAVVWSVYQNATPTIADIRTGPPGDATIDSSRKMASWTAAGIVAGISLLAKDPTVFILGGSMVVALDWWHRHANEVNPDTGRATLPSMARGGPDATQGVNDTLAA
jgi:hypothetical protein